MKPAKSTLKGITLFYKIKIMFMIYCNSSHSYVWINIMQRIFYTQESEYKGIEFGSEISIQATTVNQIEDN